MSLNRLHPFGVRRFIAALDQDATEAAILVKMGDE
jgi:hypothetical protein